jgi:hypothetical protein
MSRSIRVSALLVLCLGLIAFPAFAGQAEEKIPTFSISVGVPNVRPLTEQEQHGRILDISKFPVLLDGVALPEGPQTKQALRELYLAIDDEQGVVNAFRTYKEFEDHLRASGKLDCSALKAAAAPAQCIFFNGTNCSGPPTGTATRAVSVPCGVLVPNIIGPAWLNGPIQSFIPGCGGAILIPNCDCTTPPNGILVPPPAMTTCFNIGPNPFCCAGCAPAPPPPPPAQ